MVGGFGKTQARVDEYFTLKKIEADWASERARPAGLKGSRLAGLGSSKPAGLARSDAQLASIFFSAKYSSTLACVLPKPPTISTYKYPEAAVKEEGIQGDRREEHEEIHSS